MTKFKQNTGTRRAVWVGVALKTPGGLYKKDLLKNKHGRIVSRKKYLTAKKENRLLKHGYAAKKGKFGYVKVTPKKSSKGGTIKNSHNTNPMSINDPLNKALMAGGRRRKKRRGGTMSRGHNENPASVNNRALMA